MPRKKTLKILFIVLIALTSINTSLANTVTFNKISINQASLTLTWKKSVDFNKKRRKGEILIQFNQPFNFKGFNKALKKTEPWLRNVSTGYDTLLLIPNRHSNISIKKLSSTKIQINLIQNISKNVDKRTKLQFNLARSQLALASGQRERAVTILDQLGNEAFDDPNLILARANTNTEIGRYEHSIAHIAHLRQINHLHGDLKEIEYSALRNIRPYFFLGQQWKLSGKSGNERIQTFRTEQAISAPARIGFEAQHDWADLFQLTHPTRGLPENVKKNQYRGKLYYKRRRINGDVFHLIGYGSNKYLGAGAKYYFWQHRGGTEVTLDYNKPDWEFFQGIAYYGTQDKAAIKQYITFSRPFLAQFGLTWHRYSLAGIKNAAQAGRLTAFLQYRLNQINPFVKLLGENSNIFLDYSLDAFYPYNIKKRISQLNTEFRPYSFEKHQFHDVAITLYKLWPYQVEVSASGGYSYDVYGARGPLYRGSISFWISKTVILNANFLHTAASEQSSDPQTTINVSLLWLI